MLEIPLRGSGLLKTSNINRNIQNVTNTMKPTAKGWGNCTIGMMLMNPVLQDGMCPILVNGRSFLMSMVESKKRDLT